MKIPKFITIIMSMLFALLIAAGEGEQASSSDLPAAKVSIDPEKPGWEQDEDKVTLDWYIHFPWYTGNWGQDTVTSYISELTNVDVNFIIPAGDPNEKLNTLIVANELPDIITLGWYEDLAITLQDPRLAYNLEELAEQYDPYFFKVASKDKLNWYRQEDGAVYGYPNASYTQEDYNTPEGIFSNQTFMARKDIYEALGSPDMSTPEGFLDALKRAKEQFPTVDGQALVPIGFQEFGGGASSLQNYLQDFLAIQNASNGAIHDRDNDPEYLKWLKTLRKANEMNLISRDLFSDTRQQIEEKITQGRYFVMLYPYIDAIWPLTSRYQENKDTSYIPISGPKNSRGDEHALSGPGISGWTITLISKTNKNPEKTIRLFSFLISDKGMEAAFLGKEGETWEYRDNTAQFLPDVEKMRAENRAEFDKLYGADWLLWMFMDTAYQFRKWPIPAPEAYNMHRVWTVGKVKPRFEFENINPPGASDLGSSMNKINIRFGETLPKLILAASDAEFDSIWTDYLRYRDENNFADVQKFQTEKYLINIERLKK